MSELFQNILTASFHGSIVIAVVILLRLVLKRAPKKFICLLWLLAGIRLLMPFEIKSDLSLQPDVPTVEAQWQEPAGPEFVPVMEPDVIEDARQQRICLFSTVLCRRRSRLRMWFPWCRRLRPRPRL